MNNVPNVAPGEVLLEELLIPMGIRRRVLVRAACMSPRRINEIVLGKRGISADSAMRLQGTATSRVARKSPPI